MRRYIVIVLTGLFLILTSLLLGAGDKSELVKHAVTDLNGDGVKETIDLASQGDEGKYTLKIGSASASGVLGDAVEGMYLLDIDTRDKIKEVAVYTSLPSDDDRYHIYWYDGKKIHDMGLIGRWPTFTGIGFIYVRDWMGFWEQVDKYALEPKTHTLKLVPQELYYVSADEKPVSATVRDSVPIYQTRTGKEIIANLRKGSNVTVLLCDTSPKSYENDWYLVRSESGLCGWVRYMTIQQHFDGLPWAD